VAISIIDRENGRPQARTTRGSFSVSSIEPILIESSTVAFLVNLNPQGFVIMPGITELAPARFVSFSGNYDNIKSHPLIQQLIDECANTGRVLGYFRSGSEAHSAVVDEPVEVDREQANQNESAWTNIFAGAPSSSTPLQLSVPPLIRSKWNQGYPYYLHTPTVKNEQTVTGCVATALAQIMYFWKYPQRGQGGNRYYWESGSSYLEILFNTDYRWDVMQDSYNSTSSAEQGDAVAILMRDAGYSVNMQYGVAATGGSLARTFDIYTNNPLISYFKYSADIAIVGRSGYPDSKAWFNVMQNQIDKGWPVFLGIQTADKPPAGHAVVIDGYRTETGNEVHLNMGWGGAEDNYYSLDSIITKYGSFTATASQLAMIDIHPADSSVTTITTSPASCSIPNGSSRCSVTVQGTNPNKKLVQVWAKGPSESQEKGITGTFSDESFSFLFDWVTEGIVTFRLYDVSTDYKQSLAATTAEGIPEKGKVATFTTVPSGCTIAAGNNRCTVTVQGTNPDKKRVQVWAKGPSEPQEKGITGTFSDESFSFPFDWVFEGTVTFHLYDVSGSTKQLLATATATGIREQAKTATLTTAPSGCTIAAGNNRCTVTVQGTNPDKKRVQVWAKGPSESQEKGITGTITDEAFSFPFDWIVEGTVTFHLYDVSNPSKTLLATATAMGTREQAKTATLSTIPSVCTIAAGSNRCTVTVQGTNPNKKVVQVWARGPSELQEKGITGTFSDKSFSFPFDWVVEGTVTFHLYDVSNPLKTLLATATATGIRDNTNSNRQRAEQLFGSWTFSFKIINIWTYKYSLGSILQDTTDPGQWYAVGTNQYGKPVVAGWFDSLDQYLMLDQGIIIDNVYTFRFTGANSISGCSYQPYHGSTDLGSCYPLSGVRTSHYGPELLSSPEEQQNLEFGQLSEVQASPAQRFPNDARLVKELERMRRSIHK